MRGECSLLDAAYPVGDQTYKESGLSQLTGNKLWLVPSSTNWEEAKQTLCNDYDAGLYSRMHQSFIGLCPEYWERPELYTIADEAALKERYAHLELRDASELRLDSLCPVQARLNGETRPDASPAGKSSPDAQASP